MLVTISGVDREVSAIIRPSLLLVTNSDLCGWRLARRKVRALKFSAPWIFGDVCRTNYVQSAGSGSLSGDFQLVTRILAGAMKAL